jgi:hypothetical protein
MPDNLLRNPGFEDGAYPFDPLGIVYIPKEWKFAFRDGDRDLLPKQTMRWGRPEAGCLSPAQFPSHEHPIFFTEGSQVLWKVWLGGSYPIYFTLGQSLTLKPGQRYRFTAKVLPDMVKQYAPQGKIYIDDPDAYGARLLATSAGQTFSTEVLKPAQMPCGKYTPIALDFTAPAAAVEVTIEAYGIFSLANTGYFIDNNALVEIAPALALPTHNLLSSGSFEDGQAYFADDAQTMAVPAGWALEVQQGKPASTLLSRRKAAPEERDRYFMVGHYCWKVASPSGPGAVRLWQGLSGLTAGKTYRATALVLPDFTSAPESVEANLTAMQGRQRFESGAKNGNALPFGKYGKVEVTFTAAADRVEIGLELRTRGAASGAWVVDLIALEEM